MDSIYTIDNFDDLKFSHFAPIVRETPIIEVLFNKKIILDFSFKNDNPNEEIEIFFHDDSSDCTINYDLLIEIIRKGVEKLKAETE